MLVNMQTNMTAQNIRIVWYSLGTKSSSQSVMADKMSWPPEKFIDNVTVLAMLMSTMQIGKIDISTYQFPTSVSHPVTQLATGAYFLVLSMADQ